MNDVAKHENDVPSFWISAHDATCVSEESLPLNRAVQHEKHRRTFLWMKSVLRTRNKFSLVTGASENWIETSSIFINIMSVMLSSIMCCVASIRQTFPCKLNGVYNFSTSMMVPPASKLIRVEGIVRCINPIASHYINSIQFPFSTPRKKFSNEWLILDGITKFFERTRGVKQAHNVN